MCGPESSEERSSQVPPSRYALAPDSLDSFKASTLERGQIEKEQHRAPQHQTRTKGRLSHHNEAGCGRRLAVGTADRGHLTLKFEETWAKAEEESVCLLREQPRPKLHHLLPRKLMSSEISGNTRGCIIVDRELPGSQENSSQWDWSTSTERDIVCNPIIETIVATSPTLSLALACAGRNEMTLPSGG